MFVCAGFALIPLFAHSAPAVEGVPIYEAAVRLPDARNVGAEIRPRGDPFARPLPAGPERKVGRAPLLSKKRDARVVAIVMGASPHALLTLDDGRTQIIGVGDSIEGKRVVGIVSDSVILEGRQRLHFQEKYSDEK